MTMNKKTKMLFQDTEMSLSKLNRQLNDEKSKKHIRLALQHLLFAFDGGK